MRELKITHVYVFMIHFKTLQEKRMNTYEPLIYHSNLISDPYGSPYLEG